MCSAVVDIPSALDGGITYFLVVEVGNRQFYPIVTNVAINLVTRFIIWCGSGHTLI